MGDASLSDVNCSHVDSQILPEFSTSPCQGKKKAIIHYLTMHGIFMPYVHMNDLNNHRAAVEKGVHSLLDQIKMW